VARVQAAIELVIGYFHVTLNSFRRLFARLTFLLLLIALGLAQLNRPEMGFFTADLI